MRDYRQGTGVKPSISIDVPQVNIGTVIDSTSINVESGDVGHVLAFVCYCMLLGVDGIARMP
jgi:hypothetical protein